MKIQSIVVSLALILSYAFEAAAATRFVNVSNATPVSPYTNWSTAATTIQNAIDVADAGDEILVTNGIYKTGSRVANGTTYNRVAVTKPLTVQSINGPQFTVIEGYQVTGTTNDYGAVRCVYLTNGAFLSGFTLTNGATYAAGDSIRAQSGGGLWCESSAASASNCIVSGNSSAQYAGGVYQGTLINCVVTGNSAYDFSYSYGTGGGTYNSVLNNCLVSGNFARRGGGASGGSLNNCTLTANIADQSAGGADSVSLTNCLLYYNQAPTYPNYRSGTLISCCTTPLPLGGTGNLDADPQMASLSHLSAGSPCIGQGFYGSVTGVDIDGEPWANPPSIGCDEYHSGSATGMLNVAVKASHTKVAIGFSVDFQALISGPVSASRWEYGDGTVVSNQPFATHSWTATNNYPVTLRAYNDTYPSGLAATVTIQVVTQTVYYVRSSNTSPAWPYDSWAKAATNIQTAVDASTVPGSLILVSNGVYQSGSRSAIGNNRVAINKPLTVRSVNGPDVTVIKGSTAMRCVYLASRATLAGFSLTNGATQPSGDYDKERAGGGAWCASGSVVSNCVIAANSASAWGGGAFGGLLQHCIVSNNHASGMGGGIFKSKLINGTLSGNSSSGDGGGAVYSTLNSCTLSGNSTWRSGGGAIDSVLDNCLLIRNWCTWSNSLGGGASGGTLNNCVITSNSVAGIAGGAASSTLNNCTVARNSALLGYGGVIGGTLNNSIVYYNIATNSRVNYGGSSQKINFCCTTPMPTNGMNNITNAPLFVDLTGGDLRMCSNSPCINAGDNTYAPSSTDLDGRPRIVDGAVDIGAYEYQGAEVAEYIAWLQRYELSPDISSDYSDFDLDGLNNWSEWLASTVPTNALSVLRLLIPIHNISGLVVSWQSVTNRSYFIERSGNLVAPGSFLTLATNIPGQPGTTSYTDTNATSPGPFFYRVGIWTSAYQVRTAASLIPAAWLQQYGLPTDGSADFVDTDGDGLNNWQEWRAGTIPTSAASVLKMLSATATNNPPGLSVRWQSAGGMTYYLQRGTNLSAQPGFLTIRSNLVGQAGATSYTNTNALGSGPFFYRVAVQ